MFFNPPANAGGADRLIVKTRPLTQAVTKTMSTELDHAREIAERVARRVSRDTHSKPNRALPKPEVTAELAIVRASINALQEKLSELESTLSSDPHVNQSSALPVPQETAPTTHSPWLAGINASYSHPSQAKFGIEEATVTELVDFFEKEKTCSVEPGAKPCDHCSMCSSRGF
jgi:hypothetical protein